MGLLLGDGGNHLRYHDCFRHTRFIGVFGLMLVDLVLLLHLVDLLLHHLNLLHHRLFVKVRAHILSNGWLIQLHRLLRGEGFVNRVLLQLIFPTDVLLLMCGLGF